MMTLTAWAKGSPPIIGWWNVSADRNPGTRRFWDGEGWSAAVTVGDTNAQALDARDTPAGEDFDAAAVEWRGLDPRHLDADQLALVGEGMHDAFDSLDSRPVTGRLAMEKGKAAVQMLVQVELLMRALVDEGDAENGTTP